MKLGFRKSIHSYMAKNALLPIGEIWMDEKQEKDECRSEQISCMYCVACPEVSC